MSEVLKSSLRRTLILIAAAAIVIGLAFTGRITVSAEPAETPTHRYDFDDTDITKNGISDGLPLTNHGVVAETLDGRTYAKFDNDAYFDLPTDFISTDAVTISFDICATSAEDFQKIITYGPDTGKYFQIALRTGSADHVNVEVQLTSTGPGEVAVWGYTAFDAFELGQWYSFAVTVENGYVRMYKNGAIIQERQCPYTLGELIAENPTNLYIGKSLWDGDPYFKGGIDNLAIYNECLTPEQMAALHGTTAQTADIDSGLTQYYSFDDSEKLNADNSGNGNDATVISGTAGEGKSGNALALDGGYVALPENVVSDTNAFSFAAWIYPTDSSDWQKVIDIGAGKSVYMQLAMRTGDDGKMHLQAGLVLDGESHIWGGTAFNSVTLNTWNHVALIVDGDYARVYVNGKVINNGYFAKTIADFYATENSQKSAYIGKSQFNDPTFKGRIDEAVFYSRALSSVDVYSLAAGNLPEKAAPGGGETEEPDYDVTSDLALQYSFEDENPGVDYSGNKGNAIISGTDIAVGENGVNENLGKYAILNGKTNFIVLPANTVPRDGSKFTFAAWIYFNSLGEYGRIFDFGQGSVYFDLRLRQNGVLETTVTLNSTGGESKVSTMNNAVTLNEWQHVALTVDETFVTVYVNGKVAGAGNFARTLDTLYTDGAVKNMRQNFIGLSRYGQDPHLNAYVDEILVYHRALSANDIKALADGVKVTVENAEIDHTFLINGQKAKKTYVTADEDVVLDGDVMIVAEGLTAISLAGKLTAVDGAGIIIADNYDRAVPDDALVKDGFTVKVYYGGIIEQRIRINVGTYHHVAFDTAGGEKVNSLYVKDGDTIQLPYVVRNGYEHVGYDGYHVGEQITVTSDMVLTARYEQRDVTLTIDMRNGTYQKLKAPAGETVEIGNFGIEKMTGIRIKGEFYPLGTFTMPASSTYAYAVYTLTTLNGEEFTYTTYSGNFAENTEGDITSTQAMSLALIDGSDVGSGIIEMKITASTANDCGILFWATDGGRTSFWEDTPSQYHVALLNWEGWLLIGKVNYGQTWNCVADYKIPSFDVNHEYTMKVVLQDNNVKVYLDGVLYLDYTEKSVPAGNCVGFRCASSGVTFDVVTIAKEEKE